MGKFWPIFGLILLAFPFLEIATLVLAISNIGFWPCFVWWLISIVIGVLILRTQGFAFKNQVFMMLGGQRHPISAIIWMARRTLAAILLLLPGFLSDLIAVVLLLPWPMPRSVADRNSGVPHYSQATDKPDIIDGEYRHVNEPKSSLPQDRSQL